MKRQAKVKKDLSTPKKLVDKKRQELERLKKEIAYLEMREATGTVNKVTLNQLIERQIETHNRILKAEKLGLPHNDDGSIITAGGSLYEE